MTRAPRFSVPVLEYLRGVAEGRAGLPSWRAFVAAHRNELEAALSRADFLRLKFTPGVNVPPLLDALDIRYERDALIRRLRWADRGMDWNPEFPDPLGVRSLYAAGRTHEADSLIACEIKELTEVDDLGQELSESSDVEVLLDLGFEDEALGVLLAVAMLPEGDDHHDWIIWRAQKRLEALAGRVLAELPDPKTPESLVRALRARVPSGALGNENQSA